MTFLPTDTAYALNAKKGYRDGDADTTYVGAPLTKGSATGEGVNAPGRRQEDDVNIVVAQPLRRNVYNNSDPGMEASMHVDQGVGVRRLTPTECERLQGFPDGWTQLGDTADSRRYSALGDAVTVNVAHWIGSRFP